MSKKLTWAKNYKQRGIYPSKKLRKQFLKDNNVPRKLWKYCLIDKYYFGVSKSGKLNPYLIWVEQNILKEGEILAI